MNANAQTLTDDVRIPLHELQADVDYLIGRVVADGSCGAMIAASIKDKLAAIEAAITASEQSGPGEPGPRQPLLWVWRSGGGGGLMLNPFKLFRAIRRRIDLQLLWPSCRDAAAENGGTLHLAHEAFYRHCQQDSAWTKDFTDDELRAYIVRLT